MNSIMRADIQNLLIYFSKNNYAAYTSNETTNEAMQRCIDLLKADYNLTIIPNENGDLSANYPSQLLVPEYELNPELNENACDKQKLRDAITKARFARCRARFPVPVILCKGKYICRSATLSGCPEIYGRSGLNYLFYGAENTTDNGEEESPAEATPNEWELCDRVRKDDIRLLRTLNVGTIVDFMVEKKKVKYGIRVTSSEKVDKQNRYAEFKIISLPYPGCEFFKEFRDNNYSAEKLVFDWDQDYVNAVLHVPADFISNQVNIEWGNYTTWDLITLTQNYVKLILKYVQDSSSNILVHCISGWDRTPLYICMLRLSLWADGLIHKNLDVEDMLYLTLAYDWMFFGHQLSNRLGKGEDILFFCFYMLKFLTSDEFSLNVTQSLSDKSESLVELLDEDSRASNASNKSHTSSKCPETPSFGPFLEEYTNGNGNLLSIDLNHSPVRPPSQAMSSSPSSALGAVSPPRKRRGSSSSSGSWQMITGTGSLRGSSSRSSNASGGPLDANVHETDGLNSNESSMTMIQEGCSYSAQFLGRKDKLLKVRDVFYKCYSSTVGFKFKDGSDLSLVAKLGNIADKVFTQKM